MAHNVILSGGPMNSKVQAVDHLPLVLIVVRHGIISSLATERF